MTEKILPLKRLENEGILTPLCEYPTVTWYWSVEDCYLRIAYREIEDKFIIIGKMDFR